MEKQATKRENWKTYTQKEKTIKETKYKNDTQREKVEEHKYTRRENLLETSNFK